jgi:hypothetical protein
MAVAKPPGPPPTTTTSYSIDSRGPNWASISWFVMKVSLDGKYELGAPSAARHLGRHPASLGVKGWILFFHTSAQFRFLYLLCPEGLCLAGRPVWRRAMRQKKAAPTQR